MHLPASCIAPQNGAASLAPNLFIRGDAVNVKLCPSQLNAVLTNRAVIGSLNCTVRGKCQTDSWF